jgi:succinate dehydrogenase/fumarate reductase-like Fe-S protein
MRDYLQEALHTFNGANWYGWKTHDEQENKIPNEHRMCYECIKIIKDGAVMPTKAEVEAKIQELKDAEVAREVKKEEAKAKLLELGLTEEHLKALGI